MTDINTTTTNPVLANLSTDALIEDLKARGVVVIVKEPKAPKSEKPVKTPEQIAVEAVSLIFTVEDGKIVALPEADLTEDGKVMKEAIWEKARTTTAAIEKSKRPAYVGKPRGPKKKTETPDAPATDTTAAPDAPESPESPADSEKHENHEA